MARLRFVHAADLHLDSPFRGIRSEAPDYVADTLRRATFDAYENIVACACGSGWTRCWWPGTSTTALTAACGRS